ncbi:glycosyltransferase [uncultured Shewanella sp.]|uniref:glycosyltransferase n=1 Tax=uncultured Shewanella sp. TaxID=173975 RepID=UPI002609A9BA|nr:glycosyltransferase [uncultured Shewanella sp.]
MSKVCVLLAAYNGERWLDEQLESILKQEKVELDIFISLDSSTDNSLTLIESYVNEYQNIYLLPYTKSFGSAGQNFFRLILDVDFSKYDYLAFADQDDIWFRNKLCLSIKEMNKNKADGYSSNVLAFWENGDKKLINKSYPQKKYDYLFESSGPGCTFVLTNNLANEIKSKLNSNKSKIDLLWLHDWFCYSFARTNRFKWYIDKNPSMLYRQHDSNEVGANTGLKAIYERAKVVLSEDAFKKLLLQSDFIGNKDKPVRLVKESTFFSLLKLSFYSFKCRRNIKDVILFFFALIIMSMKKGLCIK